MTRSPLSGRRYLLAAEYIEFGGTRTYFKELLRFYHRNGAQVMAVATFAERDPEMVAFARSLGHELVRYSDLAPLGERTSSSTRPAVWSRRAYARELAVFRKVVSENGIDAVTVSVGTSGLFLSAAGAAPNPLIIAHGYPHGLRQKLLGKAILAPLLPPDATIIAVSDFSASLFEQAWHTRRRVMNIKTLRSTCGPLGPLTPLEGREPLVLTAALIEEYKRPFDWIDVASRVVRAEENHSPPDFTWLGEGPLRVGASGKAFATGLGGITFPGWADRTESYYQRARVYLQTSSIESLGLSVVDALRFGVPAVVTDVGGLPEVVLDGVNGFVVPLGDTGAAAEAVLTLLRDDLLWERQSKAARELYEDRFSPTKWNDSLLEFHLKHLSD